MELIRAEALAIGPKGRTLAQGIALQVAAGEVLALIGPNGVGKSTLIRSLLGLIPAQAGRINLQGTDLSRLTRPEIARRAALVPQALVPTFPLALRDFAVLGRLSRRAPFAAPTTADWHAVDAALDRLGLHPLSQAPITRLSGGERQLAMIARAVAQEAPLILLDEPAASLDWGNKQRLFDRADPSGL